MLENADLVLKFLIATYAIMIMVWFAINVIKKLFTISILIEQTLPIQTLFACNVILLISMRTQARVLFVHSNSMHLTQMEMFASPVQSMDVLFAILKLEITKKGPYSVLHVETIYQVLLLIFWRVIV